MRRTFTWSLLWLGIAAAVAPPAAWALESGATLYVRAKNTKVLAKPSYTASVVAILQPGQPVTWRERGAAPWHRIESRGKTGYVLGSNLATSKPRPELRKGSGSSSGGSGLRAIASEGAAVKALSEGSIAFAKEESSKGNQSYLTAMRQLLVVEAVAAQVTATEIAAQARGSGILPVVGSDRPTPPGAEPNPPEPAAPNKNRKGKSAGRSES